MVGSMALAIALCSSVQSPMTHSRSAPRETGGAGSST